MINIQEEIKKYKPIMEIDDIEKSIQTDEIRDILDILTYLADNNKNSKE